MCTRLTGDGQGTDTGINYTTPLAECVLLKRCPYCDDVHCATFIFSWWHSCCHVDGLEATHDPYASISLWQYFAVIFIAACLEVGKNTERVIEPYKSSK